VEELKELVGEPIRIGVAGLGSIGREVALLATRRRGLDLVGAADSSPELRGRDLRELIGSDYPFGVPVSGSMAELCSRGPGSPQIVLLCTSSFISEVEPELRACIAAGVGVVSSCEELAFPRAENRALWDDLDAEARRCGVAVLGTGVNPGFVMDALPLFLTAICPAVRSIRVRRVVDVSKRRVALQKKVGAGLTFKEFDAYAATTRFGHVGLRESFDLIASGVGFKIEQVSVVLEPTRSYDHVTGIHQSITGVAGGRRVLELDLEIRSDPAEEIDEVFIDAEPPVHVRIAGGAQGDRATAAILVNAVRSVAAASPGLHTGRTVPMITSVAAP
jgi:4-hydroxy-tetrahydrodipicolinate reductase